jgi:uncharacterized membrane protein
MAGLNVLANRHRLPIVAAALHATMVALTMLYVYTSSVGQAALVWVLWAMADFPASLLYLAAPAYSRFVNQLVGADTFMAQVLYLPILIHGVLGTAWWYVIVRLFIGIVSRRRSTASGTG